MTTIKVNQVEIPKAKLVPATELADGGSGVNPQTGSIWMKLGNEFLCIDKKECTMCVGRPIQGTVIDTSYNITITIDVTK